MKREPPIFGPFVFSDHYTNGPKSSKKMTPHSCRLARVRMPFRFRKALISRCQGFSKRCSFHQPTFWLSQYLLTVSSEYEVCGGSHQIPASRILPTRPIVVDRVFKGSINRNYMEKNLLAVLERDSYERPNKVKNKIIQQEDDCWMLRAIRN